MRIGVFTVFNDTGIGPVDTAVALEMRGFDYLFTADHSHIPVGSKSQYPMGGPTPPPLYRTLDSFVSLTAAAAVTKSLVVGTGVALVVQRDPFYTAKEVASLDWVSQGRFRFGVGLGWLREEIANHGVDPRVRGRVLDEKLGAIIAMWTEEKPEFHGEFVNFDPIDCYPKPFTKPYPPIYLGAQSAAGFARIGQLGAGWYPAAFSADTLSQDLKKVRDLVGADVPVIAQHVGEPTAKELEAYRDLGIEDLTVWLPTQPRDESLQFLDELHAEVAKLG